MAGARIAATRAQILAFRQRVGALDRRLPQGEESLRTAAWAGLQDSMPRAAVLSLHARVEGVGPSEWEHPALVQVWGPRYQVYVVAAEDLPLFTLARLPAAGRTRARAEELADRLAAEGAAALRVGNAIRYATLTGRLAIRWEGARAPTVRMVEPPAISAEEALRELARRFLHVFGPTRPPTFAKWAGVGARDAVRAFDELAAELVAVDTPVGEASLLTVDEPLLCEPPGEAAAARLLPSGDAYTLHGTPEERALLVPDATQRAELWTPRVWPGAVLVGGEIVGTWRRAKRTFTVRLWQDVPRDVIVSEAESLPLPDEGRTFVEFI